MEHNQAVERLKQEIIADRPDFARTDSASVYRVDRKYQTRRIESENHPRSLHLFGKSRQELPVDTGTGASTFENAALLGKDIAAVEAVFISHGHFDHGGGLARFFEINDQAKIYSSEAAVRERHFAEKDGAINKNISIDAALYERYPGRFHFVDRVAEIAEELIVIPAIEQLFPTGETPTSTGRLLRAWLRQF